MDTSEAALHALAAVEAPLHPGQEPDAARIVGTQGLAIGPKWTRPLVELRSLAHERRVSQILLRQPEVGLTNRPPQTLSVCLVNRRVRNRTHGGVGGRRGRPRLLPYRRALAFPLACEIMAR